MGIQLGESVLRSIYEEAELMLMVITEHCHHQCLKTQSMQGAVRDNMKVVWKLNKKLNRKLSGSSTGSSSKRQLYMPLSMHAVLLPASTES